MTRDDIIRMAMKAGFSHDPKTDRIVAVDGFTEVGVTSGIERFAALVAAAERAAILQMSSEQWFKTQADFESAIRARRHVQQEPQK